MTGPVARYKLSRKDSRAGKSANSPCISARKVVGHQLRDTRFAPHGRRVARGNLTPGSGRTAALLRRSPLRTVQATRRRTRLKQAAGAKLVS
jgi:hypothetical protein